VKASRIDGMAWVLLAALLCAGALAITALSENMQSPSAVFSTAPGEKNAFHGTILRKLFRRLSIGRRSIADFRKSR